ncbi:ribonuclease HII [Campylobacter mucosalis]|uniref:ribonuclease HII n=1 Tax=Campylobacter mucosalis TaxID=202 RepID=UPI00147043EA|nr:ribonuclease HII [Campylobacter mucosalis]
MKSKICGIDEAGRGSLAGPLVVAGCVLKREFDELADSKELSAKERERIFTKLESSSKYLVVYFDNVLIDELGLSECLRRSLECIKRYFDGYELLFDGNTNYKTGIKTMIKADAKIPAVSAASIIAKVSRDRLMSAYDKIYPGYGYAKHKGYGTNAHIQAIAKLGQSPLSRQSFKLKPKQGSLF